MEPHTVNPTQPAGSRTVTTTRAVAPNLAGWLHAAAVGQRVQWGLIPASVLEVVR